MISFEPPFKRWPPVLSNNSRRSPAEVRAYKPRGPNQFTPQSPANLRFCLHYWWYSHQSLPPQEVGRLVQEQGAHRCRKRLSTRLHPVLSPWRYHFWWHSPFARASKTPLLKSSSPGKHIIKYRKDLRNLPEIARTDAKAKTLRIVKFPIVLPLIESLNFDERPVSDKNISEKFEKTHELYDDFLHLKINTVMPTSLFSIVKTTAPC